MIRRTVHEWQSLDYGNADDQIPTWAADRLANAAKNVSLGRADGSGIISLGRRNLSVGQVVGVLNADGVALEILPKIDGMEDDGVRHRLIHMLSVVLNLNIDTAGITALSWQRDDLLEILIRLFAERLHEASRRGMPRSYLTFKEDLPLLRGRLNVMRQFTRHAVTPQKLACQFDDLSPDIPLNQIMKATIYRLSQAARGMESQRLLRELSFQYADISRVPTSELRWDKVMIDRTNDRWRQLLELAKLLLGGRFQTTSFGDSQGFSLLFQMNLLFEEYVGRMLARAINPMGLSLTAQGGLRYCLEEVDSRKQLFQTRPDILIKQGPAIKWVVDTKWKRLVSEHVDPKRGVSQADIYQMIAYGNIYDCQNLMLLYPHSHELGDEGIQAYYRIPSTDRLLFIATIDVSQKNGMLQRLGALIDNDEVLAVA